MDEETYDLDELREQHHLDHRGEVDHRLARLFWLIILVAVVARLTQRTYNWWNRRCHRKHRSLRLLQLLRPSWVDRIFSWFIGLSLLSFPRPFGLTIVSSLSLGQVFLIVVYALLVATLIVAVDAPRFSSHFVDDVAFRAAWVTLTQVPLVYFLSTKCGPLNILAGLSYERINWIHRWVGRILFVSATTHMAIMKSSISIQDILRSPDEGMTVVRYGIGAYSTLIWIAVTSILPLRKWSHRLFYANHCFTTFAFPFILLQHVPTYARPLVYIAMTFVAIDKCLSSYRLLWNNISIRPLKRKFSKFRNGQSTKVLAMGHPVKMMTPYITNVQLSSVEPTTVIRLCDVPFAWKPGQHVRLYLPKLGKLEVHPFTPATCSETSSSPFPPSKNHDAENDGLLFQSSASTSNDMVLMIRSHSGLTRRLADYYSHWLSLPCPNSSRPSSSLTAYVDGPYGNPPAWEDYENITLVSTSTGVTFTLAIMDYLEQLCFEGQSHLRTQRIRFIWILRHVEPQFEAAVMDMLSRHSIMLRESDIKVDAEFHVTCLESETGPEMRDYDPFAHLRRPQRNYFTGRPPLRIRHPDDILNDEEEIKQVEPVVSEVESRSSVETYVSSTLIDDDEGHALSDLESTMDELETSCWSRMPKLRLNTAQPELRNTQHCQCALIQYQRRKTRPKVAPEFISRFYGGRPNIPSILSSSVPRRSTAKMMVAICSNQSLVTQAKDTVARMNLDFAMSRRESGVEIHTECFS